ncbi:MAG: UbiD family decarboxylase, partial [Thermoplasmata archaeon]|nr:UbiD family decarboxylase [Thermoplasmata archaeon]
MEINTLRDFVNLLDKEGTLKHITRECDPVYEVSSVMKKLDGTPLIFENVKGYDMPVVANICCTRELVAKGMNVPKQEIIPVLTRAIDDPKPAEKRTAQGYKELAPDLSQLPILTYYPFDGGPYVASGIVAANDPEHGLN